MTDQPRERPDYPGPPPQPPEDRNAFTARVAMTPIWRILVRLLSIMPQVSRAQNDRVPVPGDPKKNMATPGGYPGRILAPDDWAEAVSLVPAKLVSENADWVIIPGSELSRAEDPVRALRALYAAMPPKGGYLVVQYETSKESRRESEDTSEGILAPWHWWRPKYHTAENPGRDAVLCYEAMWEFAAARDCAGDEEDIAAFADWSPRNVVIVEVRPKKAAQVAHLPRGMGSPYPPGYQMPYPYPQQPGLLSRLRKALAEF